MKGEGVLMAEKKREPVEIHPQRCYGCSCELKHGDEALAARDFPLAFCTKCRKQSPALQPAVVKGESSG